jgi:hypothetical protein
MARAAIYDLLTNDPDLKTLDPSGPVVVKSQFSTDQIPNQTGAAIVIVWRTTDFDQSVQDNTAKHFDLYVHVPLALTTDIGRIDAIIDRCDAIFKPIADTDQPISGDGWVLDFVGFEGRAQDFKDPGYETICRRASYYALAHQP